MPGRVFRDPEEKFFEDFEQGDIVHSRGRTVEASDIAAFACLTGDYYPLHIDEEFAKSTRFGTRLGHGPMTFTYAIGLMGMTGYYGDAIVAMQEVNGLRALGPVKAGDTLTCHCELTEADGSHNEKYGSITVQYTVLNQRGEKVMTFIQKMLAKKRRKATATKGSTE
jgi:3-hydroxybutyryl-CoA dehydratase